MEKKREVKVRPLGKSYQASVEALCDLVIEGMKDSYHSDFEPFESYARRIRREICGNLDSFRDRFVRGYQILLEEIEKEKR